MGQYDVELLVTTRQGILNPEATAVQDALGRIGHPVEDLVIGKYFKVSVSAQNKDEAQTNVETLADKLLANVVMEDYKVVSVKRIKK